MIARLIDQWIGRLQVWKVVGLGPSTTSPTGTWNHARTPDRQRRPEDPPVQPRLGIQDGRARAAPVCEVGMPGRRHREGPDGVEVRARADPGMDRGASPLGQIARIYQCVKMEGNDHDLPLGAPKSRTQKIDSEPAPAL